VKRTKRLQVFVHKHYETIKLGMLLFIGLLTIMIFLSIADQGNRNAAQRNEEAIHRAESAERGRQSLAKALDELKTDNERQTKLISCLLIIHGENVAITDADELSCRKALDDVNLTTGESKSQPPTAGNTFSPAPSKEPEPQEGVVQSTINSVKDMTDKAIKSIRGKQ
jgi:hypothetical protein